MHRRPKLLLPHKEAECIRAIYARSDTVLEYGSGGSTVLAAEVPRLKCFSVESDKKWAEGMRHWLQINMPGNQVVIHYSNIGRTKTFGHPKYVHPFAALSYARYPRSVWHREDFLHPDVVLIDGRFRVGCFLVTISKIEKPTTILVDDYKLRKSYHIVEDLIEPTSFVGWMALFEATPKPLSTREWLPYLRKSLNPA